MDTVIKPTYLPERHFEHLQEQVAPESEPDLESLKAEYVSLTSEWRRLELLGRHIQSLAQGRRPAGWEDQLAGLLADVSEVRGRQQEVLKRQAELELLLFTALARR